MTFAPPAFDRWVHEIRNQLSVILGFSEILLQDAKPGDTRHADLEEIHKAAGRALDILRRPPDQKEDAQ